MHELEYSTTQIHGGILGVYGMEICNCYVAAIACVRELKVTIYFVPLFNKQILKKGRLNEKTGKLDEDSRK